MAASTPLAAQDATPRPRHLTILEWVGCGIGVTGAALQALDSPYGWIAYLIANIAILVFARGIRANGLLVQQLCFTGTTLFGLARHFWPHG